MKSAKDEWGSSEVAFATAIFHTSFNLINILLLIWFVPQIAAFVQKWVPSQDEAPCDTQRLRYISQKFVDLGELNIVEAEGAIRKMSAHAQEMFVGFRGAFENPSTDIGAEITRLKKMEDEADLMMQDIVAQAFSAVDNFLLEKVPAEVISAVKGLEVQTDNMRKRYNKEAVKRMAEGDIRVEMLYTDINNQLESLANHALNIMEASSNASLERE